MQVFKVNPKNPDLDAITQAVDCLRYGGVLVYPTDTCYGIGADVTNPIAISRLFELKKRDPQKPVAVIVPSIEYVKENMAYVNAEQERIMRHYLPGPITFLLDPKHKDKFIYSKFGFRMPAYRITQLMVTRLNAPYATTSANIAEKPACYSVENYLEQIKNQGTDLRPDFILDVGLLPENPPSTVVDLTTQPPKVLREGAVVFRG